MENWVNIKYLEGYQVSNLGRIKSLNYLRTGKEQILKPSKNKYGYLVVGLSKNGKTKTFYVHRLVWSAFNGPIPEGMQINHKSEVKTDNRLENLELVTPKENCNWGTYNERMAKAKINGKTSKAVIQFDLNGKLIKEWISTNEIERQLGYIHSNISLCCNGKRKTAYGYVWKYKN